MKVQFPDSGAPGENTKSENNTMIEESRKNYRFGKAHDANGREFCPNPDQKLTLRPSDYIQIRSPVYTSHSAGRYAVKRFRKAQCPIIERLTNSMMMNGRNNGKKLMAVRIVGHAFEIVRSLPVFAHR